MKYYAIIVAGGSGNRMQQAIAKQFILLDGKPILMHTLQAFASSELQPEIFLVMSRLQQDYWKSLCETHQFQIAHQLIDGGEQRFHSVRNGLLAIHGPGIVAVHDAVRPLISPKLIVNSFLMAQQKGNAVAGIAPTDSVRRFLAPEKTEALDRNDLVLIQTPQAFDLDMLRKAYQQPYTPFFTDDASVAEAAGYPIHIIEGERTNIKITYPQDLDIAELYLRNKLK
ncbi:2-C-methyl-D-erythritol 4-phosphate cytidylyltransferase [Pedobacter sp. BAL39]|uniref:2-C-methyl-D-erythritol 4-phosphate cytidylyltransferase n=1 Tax=Pedobacter sp. BAL39 TaxID=391596 RepID=UPI00015592E5|nr:2-C-methyl-D-erythritol 4-phosphate cytidylyltransferase [Pedobacter sp. BAL39]EDM36855.1 2-C-methyl-D-erythritol 4-phosphate cytidylyltransferase [Pedobacter sp. BAL39]